MHVLHHDGMEASDAAVGAQQFVFGDLRPENIICVLGDVAAATAAADSTVGAAPETTKASTDADHGEASGRGRTTATRFFSRALPLGGAAGRVPLPLLKLFPGVPN